MSIEADAKKLTGALVGLTLIVIAIGGLIRIYDAGESCPDWPTCFGSWGFDVSEAEQDTWYQENPNEVDSRGSGHRYSTFQIFTEWFHRFLAGAVLGPLVVFNWWLVRKEGFDSSEARIASSISLLLIVLQGAVGWLTVRLDNENWSVALHLGTALAFTLSLIWLWLSMAKNSEEWVDWFGFKSGFSEKWRFRIGWLAVGAFLSVFSGTFVSTTPGANSGCGVGGFPDSWPLCGGEIVSPIEDMIAQSQLIHRWFVGVIGAALLAASYFIWREGGETGVHLEVRNWIWMATALYIVNGMIGATYILSWDMNDGGYNEVLSLIHLILASLTFLVLATAWLGSFSKIRGEDE
ncbi:MAG TPA: COX15/CtaA family protein [Candidatus Thalassarchaeaceae archaeon]|nr:COX15/CtaA family protein [Candidatus Thalassarchaeaceae archaeon]